MNYPFENDTERIEKRIDVYKRQVYKRFRTDMTEWCVFWEWKL